MSWSFRTNGNFVDFVHTDNTSLAVENTLRSLHTTSNCVEWSFGSDSTRLSFKVDDLTFENVLATDVDVDGTQLTEAADFPDAIRAVFTGLGSGDGGSGLLSATVELTDAQIKALPSTKIQIVAAQGLGKAVIPIACFAQLNTAGAYTGVTNATIQLLLSDGTTIASPILTENALDQSLTNYLFQIPTTDMYYGLAGLGSYVFGAPSAAISSYNNSGIHIGDVYEGLDNYGGGNAANTLKVTTYYLVVDL